MGWNTVKINQWKSEEKRLKKMKLKERERERKKKVAYDLKEGK